MNVDTGSERPIPIAVSEGLSERTHLVAFASGVIGCEYNHYGARFSSFPLALSGLGQTLPPFMALLRQDVLGQFDAAGDMTLLRFRIRRDAVNILRQADPDVGAVLDGVASIGGSEEFELMVRTAPRSRDPLGAKWRGFVRWVLRRPEARAAMTAFKANIVDTAGHLHLLNLLKDKFIARTRAVAQGERSRAVRSGPMFAAIESAYQELEPELLAAAGVDT